MTSLNTRISRLEAAEGQRAHSFISAAPVGHPDYGSAAGAPMTPAEWAMKHCGQEDDQ